MRVRIELPYPLPLWNRYSVDGKVASNETPTFTSPVHVVVTSYRKRICDCDAPSVKACLDGLVARGLLRGDTCNEIRQITFRSEIAAEEKTIIEIEDVS